MVCQRAARGSFQHGQPCSRWSSARAEENLIHVEDYIVRLQKKTAKMESEAEESEP